MPRADVLVLIHGMMVDPHPGDHDSEYDAFLAGIVDHEPDLAGAFDKTVRVEWGHEQPDGGELRPDQRISGAQRFVAHRVEYDAVRSAPGENNVLLSGVFGRDYNLTGLRFLSTLVREEILQYGLADALYYTSEDGERMVRTAVYDQVLAQMEEHAGADEVRLHVVGHSLGVTVAHDFLYGLFAPGHEPDFSKDDSEQGTAESRRRYRDWRARADAGALKLGTFVSMASQLPLFVMRKQSVVNTLYERTLLDASVIGVHGDTTRWVIFYDIDDLLGFTTRRLYAETRAIKEIQVDSGDTPIGAHTDYWKTNAVHREAAKVLRANAE